MSENFSADRLPAILKEVGMPVVEVGDLICSIMGDSELPSRLEVVFVPRDDKIICGAQVQGMKFVGPARAVGLEYCNEWNDHRTDARASLDDEGMLHIAQTLFTDAPLSDEYVKQNFVGRYILSATEFFREAAKKFF